MSSCSFSLSFPLFSFIGFSVYSLSPASGMSLRHVLMLYHNRLKLAVYRSLGVRFEADGLDGEVRKTIVKKPQDEAKMVVRNDGCSQYFYTDHTWQCL